MKDKNRDPIYIRLKNETPDAHLRRLKKKGSGQNKTNKSYFNEWVTPIYID